LKVLRFPDHLAVGLILVGALLMVAVLAGAKRAPDGHWYVPDPARPGKVSARPSLHRYNGAVGEPFICCAMRHGMAGAGF
jgi:hypothetical protein